MAGFSSADMVARVMRWLERSHGRAAGALLALALACFLPGFFAIPPVDRDETRFAQASRQMLATGDFIDIRNQDAARYNKPIGIYWLQSLAATASGSGADAPIWVYRLPSLIGACLVVLLTYWAALPLVGRRAGLIAAMMMASCILLGVEARLAKTDAVLTATVLAAMGALARVRMAAFEPVTLGSRIIFWVALAAGMLVKGPIILLFVAPAMAIVSVAGRSTAWLRGLGTSWGLPLALALILPWYIAIAIRSGGDFFVQSIGRDGLAKVFQGQESHGGLPGQYLAMFWLTFWPAAAFVLPGVRRIWERRRDPAVTFLLAWLVPGWIVFELVATKLPHYVLPLYPAVAMLAASTLLEQTSARIRGWIGWVLTAFVALIGVLPIFAAAGFMTVYGRITPLAIIGLILASALAVLAVLRLRRNGAWSAWPLTSVAVIPVYLAIYQGIFPEVADLWVSSRVTALTKDASPCDQAPLLSVGFDEQSLLFLAGASSRFADVGEAVARLNSDLCTLAIVEGRRLPEFNAALARVPLAVESVGVVEGFNIGNGRRVRLEVFRPKTP